MSAKVNIIALISCLVLLSFPGISEDSLRKKPVNFIVKPSYLPGMLSDVKNTKPDEMVMISCYPNPTVKEVAIQYYLFKPSDVNIFMTDLNGKTVYNQKIQHAEVGLFNAGADLSSVASGTYLLTIAAGNNMVTKKLVKVN